MSDLASRNQEELKLDLPNPITRRIGMFRSAWDRLILAWNLFKDERVGYAEKLIPVLTIAYLILPIDFLPAIITGRPVTSCDLANELSEWPITRQLSRSEPAPSGVAARRSTK